MRLSEIAKVIEKVKVKYGDRGVTQVNTTETEITIVFDNGFCLTQDWKKEDK